MFRPTQFRFAVIALFAVAAVSLIAPARALSQSSNGAGESGNSTFADPDEQVNTLSGASPIEPSGSGPRHPTGPGNSIQALAEQRTRFATGSPFSPEQLKSVPRF